MYESTQEKESIVLVHHGVEGQKWGVRNGPPYPIVSDRQKKKISKVDSKWLSKNKKRITKYVEKNSRKTINKNTKVIDKKYKKDSRWKGTIDEFKQVQNERDEAVKEMIRSVLNTNLSDLKAPSGRTVRFVMNEIGDRELTLSENGDYQIAWVEKDS